MSKITYYKSLKTGNEFSCEEYSNHGLKIKKDGKETLPDNEYPFTYIYKSTNSPSWFAGTIAEYKYFNAIARQLESSIVLEYTEDDFRYFKAAANWMSGPILAWKNENKKHIDNFPVSPWNLSKLIKIVEFTELISFNIAKSQVLPEMIKNSEEDPWDIMERLCLIQNNNEDEIKTLALSIIEKFPDKATEYKNGKTGLLGFFTGELIRAAGKGKVNPKTVNEIIKELLT